MKKMTIKEAGRYSNFINNMLVEIYMLPSSVLENSMYKITTKHLKSKACATAEDEIIINKENSKMKTIDLEKLETITTSLLEEKLKLSKAITQAKNSIKIQTEELGEIGLDTTIEYAKLLRGVAEDHYRRFGTAEERELETTGHAYTFNEEGNQVPYVYDIEKIVKLDFDKSVYMKKEKDIKLLADELSQKVDTAMSEEIVEFTPKYNYLDSLDDLLEA